MSADEQRYCTHAECRLDTLDELLSMSLLFSSLRVEFIVAMKAVLVGEVRCRHIPNRGRGCGVIANAPFGPR